MHSYLRAIGFGKASVPSEYELELLLDHVFQNYEQRKAIRLGEGNRAYLELSKSYGPDFGIRLCGELDEHGFHRQYYFPYLNGSGVTSTGELSVERRVGGDSYVGVCDDGRVGMSLIFYVQNPGEYRQEKLQLHLKDRVTTTFAGLSLGGVILLPMKHDEERVEEQKEYFSNRNSMVTAAKNGSQEAIENLTLEDMDLYTMLARRAVKEDIFSIVDTSFMPYGMECDQYQIVGTIRFFTKVYNSVSDEALYQINLECNGMIFDICINQRDLVGEPEVGRRFKGSIWLQGRLNFADLSKS